MTPLKAASALLLVGMVWLILAALAATGAPRVAFIRAPAFARERTSVTLQLRVEPQRENRYLRVEAVDEIGTARRSDEQLDGDRAPRTRWLKWFLTRGDWLIVAALYGVHGEIARASTPIHVEAVGD